MTVKMMKYEVIIMLLKSLNSLKKKLKFWIKCHNWHTNNRNNCRK